MKAGPIRFDTNRILRHISRAEARVGRRQGSIVRRRMRQILRRRKSVSAPGRPPSVHSTSKVATLKNIRYAWDPSTRTTVVGPVGLSGAVNDPAPGVQQHGGRYRKRFASGASYTYSVQPRPYSDVALKDVAKSGALAKAWQGQVR